MVARHPFAYSSASYSSKQITDWSSPPLLLHLLLGLPHRPPRPQLRRIWSRRLPMDVFNVALGGWAVGQWHRLPAEDETDLEEYTREMYKIQVEELGIAGRAGEGTGGKLRLFDATRPMVLRADAHPSKYKRAAGVNETFPNDCFHWCLPGPINALNNFLQELLKRKVEGYSES